MSTIPLDVDAPETAGNPPAVSATAPAIKGRSRAPFNADAFLLNLAPYVMACLLVACAGSVWLAAATAVPPVFGHGNMQPGNGQMAGTAGAVLEWLSNSTDAVAVLVREALIAVSGGK